MRTTLTLEPDVAAKLQLRLKLEKKTMKEIVNQALRRGLDPPMNAAKPKKVYRVKSWHGGLRPGIDLDKANQLLDEMDSQDFVEKFLK